MGMSVDYGVHLGHAYNESKGASRYEKATDAITNLGVSVLGGAVTTIGAGAALFICNMRFLTEFGAFLCTTSMLSLTLSFTFLMPALMIAGPEGKKSITDTSTTKTIDQYGSSTSGA